MSSRSIGHARCRSTDDGTHVRRYCIETADDVCVFTPASRIIWLSESYPTILLHIWLGWGIDGGAADVVHGGPSIGSRYTQSSTCTRSALGGGGGGLGSFFDLERQFRRLALLFPIFLLLFPENVGTRRRWWPAPKEKKKTTSSLRVVLD